MSRAPEVARDRQLGSKHRGNATRTVCSRLCPRECRSSGSTPADEYAERPNGQCRPIDNVDGNGNGHAEDDAEHVALSCFGRLDGAERDSCLQAVIRCPCTKRPVNGDVQSDHLDPEIARHGSSRN